MNTESKRIFYFDALRALAICCVILVHVYTAARGYVIGQYPNVDFNWIFTQIIGNPLRLGVDLFLMLTGALTLGREWDIKSFLKKRIPRIAIPFLFWNIVIIIIYIIASYYGRINYVEAFDLNYLAAYVQNAFAGNMFSFTHNWYFWMILGIYLIIPVFNKWLLHCDLKEVEYFLTIWLVTTIFEFTLLMDFPVKLSYFTSPLGLVILGYYLRHTDRKILNNKIIISAFILIPAILMLIGSYYASSATQLINYGNYSLLICMEVSGVFLLFKNVNFNISEKSVIYKLVLSTAQYSYGIYIFHYAILLTFIRHISYTSQVIYMIELFVLTLGTCFIIMGLLSKIPYINQLVGAK